MNDFEQIKNEYIGSDASLRALAEKHGVSYSAITKRCAAEGWVELRKRQRDAGSSYYAAKLEIGTAMLRNIGNFVAEKGGEGISMYDKIALTIQRMDGFMGWKCDSDAAEQDAKIRKLLLQTEAEREDGDIKVVFSREAETYCE